MHAKPLPSCLWLHGLQPTRLLCPWNSPGKNTGVGCPFQLQEIFPTQGSNLCLLHWQMDSLPLCHLGSPQRQSKGLKHLRVYFPVDLITFYITYKVLFLKYLKCHSRFVDQLPCGSILEILQLSSNSSHETHLLQVAYQNPRSLEHELNVSFSMATLTHYFFFLTGGQLLYNAVSPCCT